jgi:amidase
MITQPFKSVLVLALLSIVSAFSIAQPTNPCMNRSGIYPRPEPKYGGKLARNFSIFDAELAKNPQVQSAAFHSMVHGQSVQQLQQLMRSNKLSSVELILYYVHRIKQYDAGLLNSIIELNPDALSIAKKLDAERKTKKAQGFVHGIPVLLKDNIATADKMHTSAGTAALKAWKPSKDAALVQQLRKHGAIIFGKANMSEWANYMDPCMPSGFSTNGGQTRNPYGPYDTWGSSSGSAVAVASDFVTVSIGSETQGSIIMPAGINSIVGLKPSMGLISGEGVVPLMLFQDVAGPMGRTVEDVAVLLTALAANNDLSRDFRQAMTDEKNWKVGLPDYSGPVMDSLMRRLPATADSAARARSKAFYEGEQAKALQQKADFEKAGLTVVSIPAYDLPNGLNVSPLLQHGFKRDLNAFLKNLGKEAPFQSLEEIIAWNKADSINRAPYGMGHLINAQNNTMSDAAYDSATAEHLKRARAGIDGLLTKYGVDAIASTMSQVYAPAGYPALAVPSGYSANGQPNWIVLVSGKFMEYELLAVGHRYEQATKARKDPDLDKTVEALRKM